MTTTATTTSIPSTDRRDWRAQAACLGIDPELFFPVVEAGPIYDAQVSAAKRVCADCPVRAECLVEALTRIPDGIAGGLTEDERQALSRRNRLVVGAAQEPGPAEAGEVAA